MSNDNWHWLGHLYVVLAKQCEGIILYYIDATTNVSHHHRYDSSVSVLTTASAIRQRMAHFVHELLYHTTNDVFEPGWASWLLALNRNDIIV
jgi:hypothetical protein